jgi:hypothetical protein
LLLVPKSLLHGIPITATAHVLHRAQYLQHHNIPHGQNEPPPKKKKKPSKLHHIAILVPQDKLVMNSYMHIQLATFETHYYNINANIKNQDYWLLTSDVGIKIQKGTKLQHRTKKTQGYFPTFWTLPVCGMVQSENHNLVYIIKFHFMATF